MNKRRKVIFSSPILAILLLLFTTSLQASEKKYFDPWKLDPFIEGDEVPPKNMAILMRAATLSPLKTLYSDGFDKYVVPKVIENTNGLMKFKFYHGGVMGTEEDMIRKMKMKQIHMFACVTTGLYKLIPEIAVIGLPFLFDWEPEFYYNGKYCEIDYVIEKLEPTLAKLFGKKGVQFTGISAATFACIGSKIPLKTLADFKKITYITMAGDPVMRDTNRKVLGITNMVTSSGYDFNQMLSTGMIDSVFLGWYPVGLGLQTWVHIKYATDFYYMYLPSTLVMDRCAFDWVIAFIDKWGPRYGFKDGRDFARRFLEPFDIELTKIRFPIRQAEGKAKGGIIKRGISEVHFSDEDMEKLMQRATSLYDELIDRKLYPKELLDEIIRYREEYRELKAEGKLDEFHETGILPGKNQSDEWRTQWNK